MEELISRGHEVIALVRSRERALSLPEGAKYIIGDINDFSVEELGKGAIDYVFHLAAVTDITPHSRGDSSAIWQVNVEGTRNITRIAGQIKAKRFVHFSTIDVYGKKIAGYADESHDLSPDTLYAETKIAAERMVHEEFFEKENETRATILRLAAVYGPNMKGNYPRLVKALKERRFIPIGKGDNRRALIYERDVARAAILVANNPLAAGKIYNVSDGGLYTVNEIIAVMCNALKRRPPALYIPDALAMWSAWVADRLSSRLGIQVHLAEAVEKYTADIPVKADKIREELGFYPEYDLRAGWQETIGVWESKGFL